MSIAAGYVHSLPPNQTVSAGEAASADACDTVVSLLGLRAKNSPQKVGYRFLVDGETNTIELTYGSLDTYARRIAAELLAVARPGERVLFQLNSDLGFVAGFMGCLYAGMIAVPAAIVRRNRPADTLLSIMENADPAIILTDRAVQPDLSALVVAAAAEQGRHWLVIDPVGHVTATDSAATDAAVSGCALAPVDADTVAFLQYTSGSTSAPKGVVVTHRNLMHNQKMIRDACGHDTGSVSVGWLPMFHDMGLIGQVLQPLYMEMACVLMPPSMFLQKPIRWLKAISHYRGTTAGGPNFAYELCLSRVTAEQAAALDLSSWRVAFNGAEPVRAETLARFAEMFAVSGFRAEAYQPCYGLAEATLRVCGPAPTGAPPVVQLDAPALERNQVRLADHAAPARALVGCGPIAPFHDVSAIIVDPDEKISLQPGQVGEIWICGPNVAQGYWRNDEATAQTFHARLRNGEGPFLRTGDLGFEHEGNLFISGRLKDVIVVRGRNIYPQDIEAIVQRSSPALEIDRGAAFLVDMDGDERLIVAQEIRASHRKTIEPAAVRAAVRENVARHLGISLHRVVLLGPGGVPRTSSGKIRRRACRDHFLAGTWPRGTTDIETPCYD